ncbi:PAS domain-containing protein [Clostridium oryzae]|uniref:histidine kinase n=1 Tax=Clostridium oryzae TaxID=1450648 RepID=A0A1V4IW24_9CLOT|nr:PAS domain-containing protein [Clostridium oryzae]OPJ63984.1 sensor histidine kinase TodS [Clostridium oryzae]
MQDTSPYCNTNEQPFITVENGIVVQANQSFEDMTGYTVDELMDKSIEEVFRILRLGPSINIEEIDDQTDYFLFSKSLEVKFVNVKVIRKKLEKTYIFSEKMDHSLGSKLAFANGLASDNYYGIGIYSTPDITLISANQKYMSFFDEPYNRKENCIGKRMDEFSAGFKKSTYEYIWSKVLKTEKNCNIDEFMYDRLDMRKTYLRLTFVPIFEGEKMKYCVVIAVEVTEQVLYRKKIEEQTKIIERQKKELEAVLDNMVDGLVVVDNSGNYIKVNKTLKHWIEKAKCNKTEDFLSCVKYYDMQGNKLNYENLPSVRVAKGERLDQYELQMKINKDEIYICVSGAPIYNENGDFIMGVFNLKDITDKVRYLKILEQQKVELQTIMDNMSDLVFVLDSKANYTYKNKVTRKLFPQDRLTQKEDNSIITKYLDLNRNVIPEQDLPYYIVLKTKKTDNRVVIMKKGEKERYFDMTTAPLLDDEGNVEMVICCANDITNIMQKEKEIKDQKEQLEVIFKSIDDAIFIFDAKKDYYLANDAANQYFPNSKNKKLKPAQHRYKYYDLNEKEISVEDMIISKVFKGEVITNLKITLKNRKVTKHISINGRPVYDSDGNIKFAVLCSHDITRDVETQKVIERQKKLLEIIVKNLQESLYICDKDGKFIIKNNKAILPQAISDSSIEDLYRSGQWYRLDGTEIPIEKMAGYRAIDGEITRNSIVYKKINGRICYLLINGTPILDQRGDFMYAIVSTLDITDLMKSNQLLDETYKRLLKSEHEKNEALQKSMEMKDDFLSFISHEFRTPLNVISTAIQALNYICADQMTDKVKEYLGTIRQNTFRQLRLVNNLLDITRANAGRIKINKNNIDIVFLTKSIAESVSAYALQKGVEVTFLSSLQKKIIGIDDEKYERILLNLLSNAMKFTPKGKNIIVNLCCESGSICIEVKDKGIGIPQDKIDVIFERFGQVDSSLSRQAEGTGIGLSLVKRFVEALGGSISVKSKEGKGSTFTVLLPDEKVVEKSNEKQMVNLLDNRLIQTAKIEFSDIYL